MHLPYLAELSDRFEIAALCDLRQPVLDDLGARYGVGVLHTRWQALLDEDLDAVMVLTAGDHAPIAVAAAQRGLHVFVEKPMALSSAGAERMITAARSADVRLMVGTMKRYDPAYERLRELMPGLRDELRLVRVTTLESPMDPYISHYPLVTSPAPAAAVIAELDAGDAQAVDEALGDADDETKWCYRWLLLDCLVHEVNALRGVLGEPIGISHASLSRTCIGVNLSFAEAECHLSWVDLPGIARYKQEFAFHAPGSRLRLELPSPFLRSAPSRLIVEGGEIGTAHSWEREEIVSFDEAFKRELVEFAACIGEGRDPRTPGEDGLADVRVCEAIARAHQIASRTPMAAIHQAHDVRPD
jgi:predicted dehydrogenase